MATVTKRGDSYRIKVSCGYDVNGKQVVQTRTWRPDPDMSARQIKKELDRQCVMFEEECKKGQVVATIKFETFAEQWFEEYAKINLRNTSFVRMKQLTDRVYPAIGHLRLDKITGRHIQQFVNDLINSTSERTGKPLARKTVIHHLSFISDVFSYAVKMDMISDNPCRKVTVPKGEAKEKDIYTIQEITRVFELLDGDDVPTKFRVFFKLAVVSCSVWSGRTWILKTTRLKSAERPTTPEQMAFIPTRQRQRNLKEHRNIRSTLWICCGS